VISFFRRYPLSRLLDTCSTALLITEVLPATSLLLRPVGPIPFLFSTHNCVPPRSRFLESPSFFYFPFREDPEIPFFERLSPYPFLEFCPHPHLFGFSIKRDFVCGEGAFLVLFLGFIPVLLSSFPPSLRCWSDGLPFFCPTSRCRFEWYSSMLPH